MGNMTSEIIIAHAHEMRPCWVRGKRALFHRWTDSARPVAPKGLPDVETELRYQLWHVHGVVEYEDGTLDRVWPYEIRFAENPLFKDYAWDEMEAKRDYDDMLQAERELVEKLEALEIPRIEVTEDPAETAEPAEQETAGGFGKVLRKLFCL